MIGSCTEDAKQQPDKRGSKVGPTRKTQVGKTRRRSVEAELKHGADIE